MEYSDFEILKVAHISRFFFVKESDFEDDNIGLGKNWEYINDHRNDRTSLNRIISTYSSTLFQKFTGRPFREFVCSYMKVCELYKNKEFWMDLTKSQRKNFCIHLMIRSLWVKETTMVELRPDAYGLSLLNYNALCKKFYPNGMSNLPEVDPIIMALVLFKVIIPVSLDDLDKRRRMRFNMKIEKQALANMIILLTKLKEYLPQQLPKLLRLDIISNINNACVSYKECMLSINGLENSGVTYWLQISNLGCVATSSSQPEQINMNGLWKDNRNFIWIFPNGHQVAFRFEYRIPLKNLTVFHIEQISSNSPEGSVTRWIFHNISRTNPKRFNIGCFKDSVEDDKAVLSIKLMTDNKGCLCRINFERTENAIQDWCDWNCLTHDNSIDTLLIKDYLLKISQESRLSNLGDEISNPDYWLDTMLGADKDYFYLFDHWQKAIPTLGCDEKGAFYYKWISNESNNTSLFSASISPDRPLYIIPRRPLCNNINPDMKDAIDQLEWGKVVHILHKSPDGLPYLYFPNLFVSIPLDNEMMKLIGIRKVTDHKQFFINDFTDNDTP